MTKYFISKDNKSYLHPTKVDVPNYTISDGLCGVLDILPGDDVAKVLVFIKGNYQKSRYQNGSKPTQINTFDVRDIQEIAPTIKECAKQYYQLLENIPELLAAFQKAVDIVEKKEKYTLPMTGRMYKAPEVRAYYCISQLESVMASIKTLPKHYKNIDDYKLREYVNQTIENDSLYYALYNEHFLSLVKTRHSNRSMYEWSLSKNRAEAYLFNGDIEAYKIPYPNKMVNRLFVDVRVCAVQKNVESKLLTEIEAKIEKRDIAAFIPDTPASARKNKL